VALAMSDSAIFGTTSRLAIPRARRWPTPWVFGLLILPLGIYVGYFSTALPFLLSRSGVPVDEIARIGSLLYIPPILMFLWTPIVDVKLRRRTWLILGASVTALCLFVASRLLGPSHLRQLMLTLFFGGCVVALVAASCGGLMATMLSASAQSKAAGWNQAGNFGGGVLGAALVLWLVEHVSLSAVGLATAALVLLPALVAFTVPEPPPTPSPWFRGRFSEIRREALAVLRSPKRRWGVLLLLAPGSTCAAFYLLPALASSYGVGAKGVIWTNGIGGGVVLGLGSLCSVLVPGNWDRRFTYALAGMSNALAAIVLLMAYRPSIYFWGTLLYLLTAGLCNARYVALMLDIIGPERHDASTWFCALLSAGNIPIASMTWLEGQSFHRFGAHGLLWTDAGANLIVFAIVALAFLTRGFRLCRASTLVG
jgi:MFS transporter, PAT family, beta-lactamase induction signal transducer AmpG